MKDALRMAMAMVMASAALALGGETPDKARHVIPFLSGETVEVDGDLSEWAGVPGALTIKDESNVTFGREFWYGPQDLSATVRLAWRPEGLFVAAVVTDDVVLLPITIRDFWRGDNLSVIVDMIPEADVGRKAMGPGQFHLAMGPSGDMRVELFVSRPSNARPEGAKMAVRGTDKGYDVEAFVPWLSLGVRPPVAGHEARFEILVSDADLQPAKQESLLTVGPKPWVYERARLLPVVFGGEAGTPAQRKPGTAD